MTMRPEDYERRVCSGRLDLFYGPPGEWPDARQAREAGARQLCMSCPVRTACLEDDLATATKQADLFGFRAGLTEEERRELFQRRYPRAGVRARDGLWYYELVPA